MSDDDYPYEIDWSLETYAPQTVEREAHVALKSHRVSDDREFFDCDLEAAKRAIISASERVTENISG